MIENKRVEEINRLIKEISFRNKTYSKEQIEFTLYCERKMNDRKLVKEDVFGTLLNGKELYFARKQEKEHMGKMEERYKLIYKISNKYSLIVIVVYDKVLKVVNVIKTSKGAEKIWRKEMLK